MEEGSVYKILTGNPIGKRLLGMSGHGQEDSVRKDFQEIGISSMKNPLLFQFIRKAKEWTVIIIEEFGSGQELLESPCECGIVPPGSISHGGSQLLVQ